MNTKESILEAAVKVAARKGLGKFNRFDVAKEAGIIPTSASIISFHYGNMVKLKTAIVRHAIDNEVLPIVADAMSMGHPLARGAPPRLRNKAALALANGRHI